MALSKGIALDRSETTVFEYRFDEFYSNHNFPDDPIRRRQRTSPQNTQ